jgi:UDP-glucose 4-epimerase
MRITNPYGPYQRPEQRSYGVINQFIHEAMRGGSITVFGRGEQLRDYIHVDDVVEALLAVAMSPAAAGATYNLGSGTGTSLADLAALIVEVAGSGQVEHVPWPQSEASVETGDFCADITRVEAAVGWSPRVKLRDGIQDVITRVHRAPHQRA